MPEWTMEPAQRDPEKLLEAARTEPQIVTQDGEAVVVFLNAEEFERLKIAKSKADAMQQKRPHFADEDSERGDPSEGVSRAGAPHPAKTKA